jgi:plastocyanin
MQSLKEMKTFNSGQDGVVRTQDESGLRTRDDRVRRGGIRAGTALLGMLAMGAGLTIAAATPAAAAGCAATVTISGPSHGHLVLSPNSVKVQTGQCVAFVNSTSSKVTLSVSRSGKTLYSAGISKGGAADFTASSAGTDAVSASSQVLLLKFTGGGSVTATAPPSPHPTKSNSPTSPNPKHTPSSPTHPKVASNPKHPKHQSNKHGGNQKKKSKQQTPTPHATGIKLPPLPPLPKVGVTALPKGSKPVVAPGQVSTTTAAQPGTTTSTSPVAAVLSGPIEPLDSNRRGLPVAIGVLVVLGIATGWGRVLLATSGPGDNRFTGDHQI